MEIIWGNDYNPGFLFLFPPYTFQISAFALHFNLREIFNLTVHDGKVTVEQRNEKLQSSLLCSRRGE